MNTFTLIKGNHENDIKRAIAYLTRILGVRVSYIWPVVLHYPTGGNQAIEGSAIKPNIRGILKIVRNSKNFIGGPTVQGGDLGGGISLGGEGGRPDQIWIRPLFNLPDGSNKDGSESI